MNRRQIVEIKFGSHLYGTSTPESDLDIKSVYLPTAQDILLQRVKPVIAGTRSKAHGQKNSAEDVDREAYSPEKFLRLLAEGQTVALDMLFAPDQFILSPPDPLWQQIKIFAPKILTKKTAIFMRYCRQQAHKYGLKGERITAARQALSFLKQAEATYGSGQKLEILAPDLKNLAAQNRFLIIDDLSQPNGQTVGYIEICGKKAMFDAPLKSARSIAQKLVAEYGDRALKAEQNEGIDWKALSHAVRVGHESLEFLQTHHITFPRPESAHLLAIKKGQLSYQQVSDEIEDLLEKVEMAAENSTLPEYCDINIIDDFIEALHRHIILTETHQ